MKTEQMFPESIEINVRDGKVISLNWSNAIEVIKVENENVTLLPFSEILNYFKKQVFRTFYLDPEPGEDQNITTTMKITRICFSYMRVKKQDGDGKAYLLPVWDFMCAVNASAFPNGVYDSSEEKVWLPQQSILTINAIDGSIIDRNAGY